VGFHLFTRIMRDGGQDGRFDRIRNSFPGMVAVFMAQATWVSLCLLPVMAVNSLPPSAFKTFTTITPMSLLGLSVWVFGLAYEMAADRQKTEWLRQRKEKKHSEEFLTKGMWSKSRYPNYFGEITLWSGVGIAAGGILSSQAAQMALGWTGWPAGRLLAWVIAATSPAFSYLVLVKVSPLST
jgi:steroid 5-alpha reductase family enzyme